MANIYTSPPYNPDKDLYSAGEASINTIKASVAARSLAQSSYRKKCWDSRIIRTLCKSQFLLRLGIALALFFSYVWMKPDSIEYLYTKSTSTFTWFIQHPDEFLYRTFSNLRIERLLVTAAMTWMTTKLATYYNTEAHVLSEYANRISLQVNFLTQNSTSGMFELDWVTVSEEAPPVNKAFRNVLKLARKRKPALMETCPLLCPLSMRGLLPGGLSDLIVWNTLSSYASSKLINNLGINHTLAGLPVKVSDIVMTLTFEREEQVGNNPLGGKMRLLITSKEDLVAIYKNWQKKQNQQKVFLKTKTGTTWSHMRLKQLEELACHFHQQPMSKREFDKTRCYGLLRLYTPMVGIEIGTEDAQQHQEQEEQGVDNKMIRQTSRPVWKKIRLKAAMESKESVEIVKE